MSSVSIDVLHVLLTLYKSTWKDNTDSLLEQTLLSNLLYRLSVMFS